MYSGVPKITPERVSELARVRNCDNSSPAGTSFARPKSRIFTNPSAVTIRFPGLISRCAMPDSCALEAFRDLRGDVNGLPDGHRTCFQQIAHSCAFDQLHRYEMNGAVAPELMDGDDVGVVQR